MRAILILGIVAVISMVIASMLQWLLSLTLSLIGFCVSLIAILAFLLVLGARLGQQAPDPPKKEESP